MRDVLKKVIGIIEEHFPNGIRDDFIDTSKVRKIYLASYSGENITQNIIAEIIRANGIKNGKRFYFISDENSQNIRRFFEEILKANSIIYYAKIYEKHSKFFSAVNIFSPEVLRRVLQTIFSGPFYSPEFCAAKIGARLDYMIDDIFTDKFLTLEELQEKLPYIPSEKIFEIVSNKKKYLYTKNDKFFPLFKIQFDLKEIYSAKQKISSCIEKSGYALPEDYSLSSNFLLNPQIAEKDLRNVIYEKFFATDFKKNDNKLLKKNNVAEKKSTLIRECISEQKELSLKKLIAFEEEIGFKPKQINFILDIAYETMIRVNKNLLVEDSLIKFDIAEIDKSLSPFVNGKIISLRSVTSFTGFPPVEGYSWNLFLLESFLRKYSQKYVFDTAATGNANVGAIYPAFMKFKNYIDVQANVIIQENISLKKFAVEEFLIAQGFRAYRNKKAIEMIIKRAQEFLYY